MKTRFLVLAALMLAAVTAKAQNAPPEKLFPRHQVVAPYKVEVTFSKTVHILFPAEVKYVDLGSTDIIAGKASGAENVVRVKAAIRDFEGETNFSVITADGCFYSFNTVYSEEPAQLSVEMEDWLRRNPSGGFAADRMFVQLKELGGETPVLVNKIMFNIWKKNKRDVKHIGSKKFQIQALLKGIYIHGNLLYFHTQLKNLSHVPFDIDYVRFKVVDKKVVKRTAIQETMLYPVRTFNHTTTIDGKAAVRNVFVLEKITIPDDKVLVVEIYERGGGRHQTFNIEDTDLTGARLIDELKLK